MVNAVWLAFVVVTGQLAAMPRHSRRPALPVLFARLAAVSAETIWRRTLLMARGQCSPAEYRRMVEEKQAAARLTAAALMHGQTDAAKLLLPWHKRAAANAKRLR
jgi:hypothetical protein